MVGHSGTREGVRGGIRVQGTSDNPPRVPRPPRLLRVPVRRPSGRTRVWDQHNTRGLSATGWQVGVRPGVALVLRCSRTYALLLGALWRACGNYVVRKREREIKETYIYIYIYILKRNSDRGVKYLLVERKKNEIKTKKKNQESRNAGGK